jgi:hypothetical protein
MSSTSGDAEKRTFETKDIKNILSEFYRDNESQLKAILEAKISIGSAEPTSYRGSYG